MRCAILTISTSIAAGEGEDISGPALADAAAGAGAEVIAREVVADERAAIEVWLRWQVADGVELIFTTGGTGLTPDDVTPEATNAVIDREGPGSPRRCAPSRSSTRRWAILTRGGRRGSPGGTLIINFPGNPKAIAELFPVIAPTLGHAVATLQREDGKGRGH